MAILRSLNETGMQRLAEFIDSFKSPTPLAVPTGILTDDTTSTSLPVEVQIEPRKFGSRFEAAKYLYEKVSAVDLPGIEGDPGLWSWLALFYFDEVCPPGKGGVRKPGELARWIPELSYIRRYYRHLILGPYLVYKAHADNPERALGLLCDPMDVSTSEVYRLLIENTRLVTSRGPVAIATILYYDPQKGKLRRGAGSKGPGGCRRLVGVLQQFDCTFDLPSLTGGQLLTMLPREFDKFRRQLSLLEPALSR